MKTELSVQNKLVLNENRTLSAESDNFLVFHSSKLTFSNMAYIPNYSKYAFKKNGVISKVIESILSNISSKKE